MKKFLLCGLWCVCAHAVRDPFSLPVQKTSAHVCVKALFTVDGGPCEALVESNGVQLHVRVGDKVGDWVVKEVTCQHITLENHEHKIVERIGLEDGAKLKK